MLDMVSLNVSWHLFEYLQGMPFVHQYYQKYQGNYQVLIGLQEF
eukprot:UN04471